MSEERDVLAKAQLLVDSFIMMNHAAAIPALVGACVGWAVQHGAGDLVRDTLLNAVAMSRDAERAWKASVS